MPNAEGKPVKCLIAPDEVPRWIPGSLTLDGGSLGWDGVTLKGYRYEDLDVVIPPMRDYMLVRYKGDEATMSRRAGGAWRTERVSRGVFSLLTRCEQSQWRWDRPIDVSHIYLQQAEIARVAEDVFERGIEDVRMEDAVRLEDRILPGLMNAYEYELCSGGLGGNLYLAALNEQLCVHLLRHHAKVSLREAPLAGRLANWQRRRLVQYIEENLDSRIALKDLASEARISVSSLIRKFQVEFGCAPHAYVLQQRVEHARRLLAQREARAGLPLKLIAAQCGFADQSHLVRHFKRAYKQTPTEYRGSAGGSTAPSPRLDAADGG